MSQIEHIVGQVVSGTKSARSFVDEALAKAEKVESYHALLALTTERARKRADEIDAKIANGEPVGRLAGVPFVAKDNMLAFGAPTTAAAKILEGFDAPFQAEAIERLEAEGAICIGKANLDAFAHGGSTENSAFGPTKNPHDETRVPGGSSGGSAAIVELGVVPFALGTDTGGSIRQPASFTGVVGMKPTYGTVSRYGVVAMASSTDVIGPLAKSVDDAIVVLDVMAGKDDKDSTTLPDFFAPLGTSNKPLRIGVVKEWMDEGVSDEVKTAVDAVVSKLKTQGHSVEQVSLPTLPHALAVYYIVVPAEVASNLARYDGVRYGSRDKSAKSLSEVYSTTRNQGFMPENKRRILIGNYVLSSGYYDAYYRKAQQVRTLIINDFNKALESYDLLVGPVAPTAAFKLGENTDDPLQMYLADIMTVPASLAGLPAVSIPAGTGEVSGLPIGIQVIGRQQSDAVVLSLAKQIEELS
jgi:aspartyl-tRNA(Asn)/glutamyl-tRNA(Gln) amidotransferase subunit A